MTTGQPKEIWEEEGEVLAESLAGALNAAEIPCVLWGQYLWSALGVPTTHNSLDLVVPDAKFEAARQVIRTSTGLARTLIACPDTTTCIHSQLDRYWPRPSFHRHIEGTRLPMSDISYAVSLYVQSKTLWFLPPLGPSLASPRANPLPRYLALASDPTALPPPEIGKGKGIFSFKETMVLVPRAHILTEALMRIIARDSRKQSGHFISSVLAYMNLYVKPRGLLNIDLLPEPFGMLYTNYCMEDGQMDDSEFELKLMRAVGVPVRPSQYL